MEKPDEAHFLTDAELEKLERRIAAEYKKAADELTDKINAYFESFKKWDAETKALTILGDADMVDDVLKRRAADDLGRFGGNNPQDGGNEPREGEENGNAAD